MEERITENKQNIIANTSKWKEYYKSVHNDYRELKRLYPFSNLCIPPTVNPSLARIHVVAVSREIVERTCACRADFTSEYSKELFISVPEDYQHSGCNVYGGKWIDVEILLEPEVHLYVDKCISVGGFSGYKLCVGTPESFQDMNNVILENVRTADNMLVAYERRMKGENEELELLAYSHGDKGKKEYRNNKHRYHPK